MKTAVAVALCVGRGCGGGWVGGLERVFGQRCWCRSKEKLHCMNGSVFNSIVELQITCVMCSEPDKIELLLIFFTSFYGNREN